MDCSTLLCGNIEEVVKKINAIPERLKNEHTEVKNNPNKYYTFDLDVSYDLDEGVELCVYGWRMETDEDFVRRKKKLEQAKISGKALMAKKKKQKEEEELKLYQKLKTKYDQNK